MHEPTPHSDAANPFGITREEVLALAARKLADNVADNEYIAGCARSLIQDAVRHEMKSAQAKVDAFLAEELKRLVSTEIAPVNIWGDKVGEPVTIRDMLAQRAKTFWEDKVDKDGKPTTYGGLPRHQQMFGSIVQAEFANAIKQDLVNIVGALKDALIDDCNAKVREKIDELIRVKTKK